MMVLSTSCVTPVILVNVVMQTQRERESVCVCVCMYGSVGGRNGGPQMTQKSPKIGLSCTVILH